MRHKVSNLLQLHTTKSQSEALYWRAHNLETTDPVLATRLYEGSHNAHPGNTSPLVALGRLAWQNGQYDEAERLLSLALSINASDAPVHFMLGHVYYSQGKYNESVLCFNAALQHNRTHYESMFQLAMCLEKLDMYHQALFWWENYLRAAPEGDDWRWVAENSVEVLSVWK